MTDWHAIEIDETLSIEEVARRLAPVVEEKETSRGVLHRPEIPLADSVRLARSLRAWIGDHPERFEELAAQLPPWEDPLNWLLDDLPWALGKAGRIDELIAHSRSYAEVTNPAAFLGDLAVILAEEGRHDEALLQTRANLERFPDDPWIRIWAGEVHGLRGELELAEAAYRKAFDLAGGCGCQDTRIPARGRRPRPDRRGALSNPSAKGGAQDRSQRSLPLREREEGQAMLRR